MNRRWITLAVVVVAVIGLANIFILLVVVPRWSKATSSAAVVPVAPVAAAPAAANPPVVTSSTAVVPVPASQTVAAGAPLRVAHHPPPRPAVQPGMRLERQVLTPSGNLRIDYMRDRQQGLRQIIVRDSRDPNNSTVLAQYKRNAWAVVSPDDSWIVLNSRDGAASGAQLYHRVSAAPLKYEIPEDLRANPGGLQDVVWQSYLGDTQQDGNTDRGQVTIDGIAWQPDSHKVALSVAPIATKNDATLPEPWTCNYDVTTREVESPQVADGPAGEATNDPPNDGSSSPNDVASAPPDGAQAAEGATDAAAPADATQELDGERFPATREEAVTMADVNELELTDIRYAIFEMFARHGAEIHDAKMGKAFSQFDWYQPRAGVSFDDIETEFSDVEKKNLAVLRRCRDAKVAASHRSEPRPVKGQPVEEDSPGQQILKGFLRSVGDALNNGGN